MSDDTAKAWAGRSPEVAAALDEEAEAAAAAEGADALAADIERRIVAGVTDDVSLDDIEAAEKAGRLARLRARRAAGKAERHATQARVARIAELREQVETGLGRERLDAVLAQFDAGRDALAELCRLGAAYNADLTRLGRELAGLAPLPGLPGGVTVAIGQGPARVTSGATTVTEVDVAGLLMEAVLRALGDTGQRQPDLGQVARYTMSRADTGAKYGVGRNERGQREPWGPSDVLRWRAAGSPDTGYEAASQAAHQQRQARRQARGDGGGTAA